MKYILSLEALNVIMDVMSGVIRGMGYSTLPAIVAIVGVCEVRLLWVNTIFKQYHTFEMLLAVYPVSWFLTSAAMIIVYIVISRKLALNN